MPMPVQASGEHAGRAASGASGAGGGMEEVTHAVRDSSDEEVPGLLHFPPSNKLACTATAAFTHACSICRPLVHAHCHGPQSHASSG